MKFKVNDKVRVKKLAGKKHGGKEYNVKSTSDIGFIEMNEDNNIIGEGWLQLILESPKLTLRLSQKGLKLKIKILEQDDSLRDCGIIASHENCEMCSSCYPHIEVWKGSLSLYIKGYEKEHDKNKISHEFNSQDELDEFVEALRVMIKSEGLM